MSSAGVIIFIVVASTVAVTAASRWWSFPRVDGTGWRLKCWLD